jgi:uncharacterized protein
MDLTLILTEDCNLRCAYCYQKNFRRNEMPVETGVAAVRAAVSHLRGGAQPPSLALTYFGGEPLLRAGAMFEIQAAARNLARGAGVAMTAKAPTNGLLLTEPIVERAGELGIFISLSFDGGAAALDAGRVRPDGSGSFDDACRALRLLVQSRRPFGVYSVITPQNVRHLADSRRFLWDMGARILVGAIDYTAHWDDAAVATLVEQYERVGEMYRRLLKRRAHFHLEPIDSRISQRTRPKDWQRCVPGVRQVTAGPDGTLYGCVEFFYRRLYPLGDVHGWLDPEKVKAFATLELAGKPEECTSCGVRDRCTNSCACVNLRTTGVANRPPESVCHTEQATILTIDRLAAKLYAKRSPEFLMRHYSGSYHLLYGIEQLLKEYGVNNEHEPDDGRPERQRDGAEPVAPGAGGL